MTVLGFTRPAKRLEASVKEAESRGFTVLAAPSLEILPGEDSEFERMERLLEGRPTVIFGSSTAVEECSRRYGAGMKDVFGGCRIISIGPSTTHALGSSGISAEEPGEFSSYGIVEMLSGDASGRMFVLVRSDSGSDVQTDGLTAAGGKVESIAAYRLKPVRTGELELLIDAVADGRLDVMAFTSPLSAQSFVAELRSRYGEEADIMLSRMTKAAIGRPTAEMMSSLGHDPDIVPEKTTFADLLDSIKEHVR